MSVKDAYLSILNGMRGAEKFAAAIASGDVASMALVQARMDICRECPHKTNRRLPLMQTESSWCGQPLEDHMDELRPTCGCLIAGKVRVESERCPQDKW